MKPILYVSILTDLCAYRYLDKALPQYYVTWAQGKEAEKLFNTNRICTFHQGYSPTDEDIEAVDEAIKCWIAEYYSEVLEGWDS